MNYYQDDCLSCQSLRREKRIPPGDPIFISKYWTLEHKGKSPIYGWLILVLNTHKSSLDQLSPEEWYEFSMLLPHITSLLKNTFDCAQQYVCQFAAKPGFQHVHWHIIPIQHTLPAIYQGSKIFSLLDNPLWKIADNEIVELTKKLQVTFQKVMEEIIF
jgi:diadenosine tetraphosphate (Ap4A) HIT family hydrolase